MDLETAHAAEGKGPLQKWLAALVGLSAVVAASLATLDLHSSKRYEDLVSRSSRESVNLFGRIAGSSFPVSGMYISSQIALFRSIQATSRELVSTVEPEAQPLESALARAEKAAAERLTLLAETIGETPSLESGVDATTRDVIGTGEAELTAIVEQQNEMLDEATRYGNRSSRAIFALSLVALATVLLGLAAVMGARSGAAPLVGGAGALLVIAIGWGLTAFLE
ncbi:MAG TPA: hypothetical protein VM942_04615 [Acidimicrobiales bacterium]|nr:hypothetical protein [Acidimicrobiales bacterium]